MIFLWYVPWWDPWKSHYFDDIPMIFPWYSKDIPMIFPWDTKQGYWREYHGGHQDIYGHQDSGVYSHHHWIGLRDNLQETMVLTIKYGGFRFQLSRKNKSNDHDIPMISPMISHYSPLSSWHSHSIPMIYPIIFQWYLWWSISVCSANLQALSARQRELTSWQQVGTRVFWPWGELSNPWFPMGKV